MEPPGSEVDLAVEDTQEECPIEVNRADTTGTKPTDTKPSPKPHPTPNDVHPGHPYKVMSKGTRSGYHVSWSPTESVFSKLEDPANKAIDAYWSGVKAQRPKPKPHDEPDF